VADDSMTGEQPTYRDLLDQPYENAKTVRVTGPFTVESLSPHRMLDFEEQPTSEETREVDAPFAMIVLDNLREAGVQNTVKQEHLDFEALEPFAGALVHARGEFVDADGQTRTVAICIGPEHGTVGANDVKEAAKEALKGIGFDLLLVCAFAFDAHAGETAKEFQPDDASGWAVAAEEKRFGELPVLLVRMNPDLAMGDELLKKTGTGNLFMVFGEPDVAIERTEDGQVEVEIRGVDVYDPTTGQVRSSSVDDVACWFIDTSYNDESFFSATPTSPAPRIPTAASSGRSRPTSTRTRGRACTAPAAGPSPPPPRGASPSRSSTTTATRCLRPTTSDSLAGGTDDRATRRLDAPGLCAAHRALNLAPVIPCGGPRTAHGARRTDSPRGR